MANLQIKNLPADVHEELRRRAEAEDMTVRDYVLRLLQHDQARPTRAEWWARIRARPPVDLGRPAAELIAEDRAEREAQWEERLQEFLRTDRPA